MSFNNAPSGARGSVKVLVLEDNSSDLLLLQGELADAFRSVEIVVANRLSEAISLARAQTFDVCLLDLNVPDSSGVATFEALRAEARNLPLIIWTGTHDERVAGHILRNGAQDYLIKQPGMSTLLTKAIRFAIERNKVQVELDVRDAQLLRSEAQMRRIIESSADAVIVVDGTGIVRFANPAAWELFGRTLDGLVGRDFGFPLLSGQSAEIDIVRPDLSAVIAEMRVVDVMWEEKAGLLASLRDVTERKREREALELRAQLASLSADIGFALTGGSTSLHHGLQLAAEVLARYRGVAFARIWRLDETTQELLLEASAGAAGEICETGGRVPLGSFNVGRIAKTGKPCTTDELTALEDIWDTEWARREGLTSFAGYPIEVEQHVVGVLVAFGRRPFAGPVLQSLSSESRKIGQFITRKLAEEQLIRAKEAAEVASAAIRESSDQLNLALRASRTGIWTWDAAADRIAWDDRTHEMFGVPRDRFGGTLSDLLALVHPEDRDLVNSVALSPRTVASSDIETEFRVVHRDGRVRYLVSRGRAYTDESGRLLRTVGTAQDVTEQRQLEEQLRQSQKMEAVGRLAGGIAHDFNNILNVVIGYSSVLLRDLKPDDPMHRRVQEIRKAADRATALTKQLLAFSRKQILKPRVLNLGDTLRDMDHMVRPVIGEDVEISTHIDPNLGNIKVDPSQMEQVILNLVVNARDAMPGGGRLMLGLTNTELDESYARLQGGQPGRYVVLTVRDTGCGMTPEVQKRIFEPFYTTKDVGKGTGLGLATVYGIVQQSGGHIYLYSEPGVGTIFKIYFPQVDAAGEPLSRESQPSPAGGDETILLVEDDSAVREQITETLRSVGYHVIAAKNGDEASLLSDGYPDQIHLLLTDVVMPKMPGPEVARRLAASRPNMKVIFMSGHTGDAMAHHGTSDAGVNLLEKPFTPEVLCEQLRAVLSAPAR